MNPDVKNILDNIVEDRQLLKHKMLWEADPSAVATLSAFLYASVEKRADIDRYMECKKYLKQTVSAFSEIRGIASAIIITKMTLQSDYKTYLAGVTEVYKKLRSLHKLTASPYMVMAAANIYEAGGLAKADDHIAELERVYAGMKSDHFFLTGDEDRPFLALLISRGIDIDAVIREIETCYNASKSMSFSKEAMHTASQILALSGKSTNAKVEELAATMSALKEHQVDGMKYELMPIAAALTFIDASPDAKAAEIKEIYDYLRTQKGFGLTLTNTKRAMYAALAYAIGSFDADKALFNSVISSSITGIIIDEIISTIIITSAVVTTAASSSSSSSN